MFKQIRTRVTLAAQRGLAESELKKLLAGEAARRRAIGERRAESPRLVERALASFA